MSMLFNEWNQPVASFQQGHILSVYDTEIVFDSTKHVLFATFIEPSGFYSLPALVHIFFYHYLENEMVLYYKGTTESCEYK